MFQAAGQKTILMGSRPPVSMTTSTSSPEPWKNEPYVYAEELTKIRWAYTDSANRLEHLVATALYAEKYLDRTIDFATLDDTSAEFRELESAVTKDNLKSFVPVVGPAINSGRAAGEDRTGAAVFHGSMCALDIFIITGIGRKSALKGIELAEAKSFSVAGCRDILAEWYARQPLSSRAGGIQIGPSALSEGGWRFGAHKSIAKWRSQMTSRGWTEQQIAEAMKKGQTFRAENLVSPKNSATRYVHPQTGKSVVVDDVTKEVLHVGGEGFQY